MGVTVADDPANALVGIVDEGPVKKNTREVMAEFINNSNDPISITVALDSPGEGTLYDNQGQSGDSITFSLDPGNSQFVDLKAGVTGTILYDVSVDSPTLSLEATRSVESEAGNNKGAIRIKQPRKDKDFTADRTDDEFQIDKVDIEDDEAPDDLDRIEFRAREGGAAGTVVGSLDVDSPPADRYNPNGNPAVAFSPDSGYSIKQNTTYYLTVTAYDEAGNSDSVTVEDNT